MTCGNQRLKISGNLRLRRKDGKEITYRQAKEESEV